MVEIKRIIDVLRDDLKRDKIKAKDLLQELDALLNEANEKMLEKDDD